MQHRVSHEVFDPGEYDPEFKFDLDLTGGDYLLLALYIIFFAPLELVAWAARSLYRWFNGVIETIRYRAHAHPNHGLWSLVSKIF